MWGSPLIGHRLEVGLSLISQEHWDHVKRRINWCRCVPREQKEDRKEDRIYCSINVYGCYKSKTNTQFFQISNGSKSVTRNPDFIIKDCTRWEHSAHTTSFGQSQTHLVSKGGRQKQNKRDAKGNIGKYWQCINQMFNAEITTGSLQSEGELRAGTEEKYR